MRTALVIVVSVYVLCTIWRLCPTMLHPLCIDLLEQCLACLSPVSLIVSPRMPRHSFALSTSFFSFGIAFNAVRLMHMGLCDRCSCTQGSRQVCFICHALTCQNRVWHGNTCYLVNADGDVWQGLLCMCPGRTTLASRASSVMS